MDHEAFLDWVFMSVIPLLILGGMYLSERYGTTPDHGDQVLLIRLPVWLAVLISGVTADNCVSARTFAWQMMAIFLLLCATFLAVFVPDHELRVAGWAVGFVVSIVAATVFIVIVSLVQRRDGNG